MGNDEASERHDGKVGSGLGRNLGPMWIQRIRPRHAQIWALFCSEGIKTIRILHRVRVITGQKG